MVQTINHIYISIVHSYYIYIIYIIPSNTGSIIPYSNQLPSGYVKIAIENHHAIYGKIHYFYGHFQ